MLRPQIHPFTVTDIGQSVEVHRKPRRTDWESFRSDLLDCLRNMTDKISNFTDTETAAKQFQDATVFAYNENCPFTVRKKNRNTSWGNQDLAERRKKVQRLFNVAKKSQNWTDYKITLTDYNKALRQANRESWRRRLRRLQNVPNSIGFFQRTSRVR